MAEHQQRRHAAFEVVLGDEGFEHLHLGTARTPLGRFAAQCGRIVHMPGKVRAVAQMPPATHHREVHAGAAALHLHREDVGILGGHAGVVFHGLLVQHARQRADLVADLRRLFEVQGIGVRHHLRLQTVHDLLLLAAEESLGVAHVARVVLGRDVAHAGRRAALDLVEQTRPRTVGEDGVLAGAQLEDLLQ